MKKYFIVLISLALVACGNIPKNSSIQEGSILGSVPEGSIVRVIASVPQEWNDSRRNSFRFSKRISIK
jgi:hypothetical protein